MNKRFLSILITLCMVMSILPGTALAVDYNIWVGDTQVTSTNMSGAGWSYDSASSTLTLNNATITENHTWVQNGISNTAAIYSNGSLSIELVGDNTVIGEDDTCENSYGIYVENSSVTSGVGISISGNGTIIAQGGNASSLSYGIYAQNFILVFGGTIISKSISDAGTAQAVNQFAIANSHNVTASTEASGTPTSPYNPGNISTYKYLKFEPFPASAPNVTTDSASDITATTATLNGTVNANGASTAVTFEYGTSLSYGASVTASQSPVTVNNPTPVSASLSGLTPNTTYHYRVKAVNIADTTVGSNNTFTTLVALPTVTASNISVSGATGTDGAFKIGDTVTATWNNTIGGDNNSGITGVTMNFSQFGGGATVAATNSSGNWTATYTITAGNNSGINKNVTVTATNTAGQVTKSGTTNSKVDNIAPTINLVTVPANATYKAGDNLDFTVNFGENVTASTGGGTPYFPLTIGASTKNVPYVSGSGTAALRFRYTVSPGDSDADGIACASPITLNGGTIRDYVGNNAALAFTPSVTTSILVDTNTVPGAPTIGTATAGDTQATVSFTAPASNGGAAITGYTVTSSPGGFTATGASSPMTVTGLTNGTPYTFTVTATNSAGTGVASAASNSVTPRAFQAITFVNPGIQNFGTSPILNATASSGLPVTFTSETPGVCTVTSGGQLTFVSVGTATITANQSGNGAYMPATSVTRSFTVNSTVPGAPTIGTATAGDTQATVSFTAPASNGGAAITGYTVTSSPGGFTATGASSPIVVTGLTNGTPYTFTVTATNSAGTGVASAASNSVTPQAPAVAPTITKHPSNWTANPGDTYTFSVTASGTEPFSYKWQIDESGTGNAFVFIPSATDSSYTIPSITYAMNGYKYRCQVSNSEGSVYSNQASLTVNRIVSDTPTASVTTVSKSTAVQSSVSFSLTKDPVYANGQTWKVYSGATGSTLATGVTATNTGNTLTLTHTTDIPSATYYVSVTESLKEESARLALTVGAYVPATYTVTYKSGTNGTGSEASDSKTHDVALTLKGATFTREGFTQTGWATSDGGAKAYDLVSSYTSNASINLYPVWTVNTYTITYTAGENGSILGTKVQSVNYGGDGSAVTAEPNPGYHFVSWSDGVLTSIRTDKNIAGNISVNASFAINTYTVTYKRGVNGTGSEVSDSKTHDVALTLKGATFTREGFTQTGWATSDGGAKGYDLGSSYTANEGTELYPVWTANAPNTYTVTLPTGIGYTAVAYDSSSTPVTSGGNYSFTVTIVSGYHKGTDFSVKTNGTPITADGSGVYIINNITQTQTVTVEGVVQDAPVPTAYTVSFDTNGGLLATTNTQTNADNKLATLPTPTRTSYSFNGWFTALSGGTQVTSNTVFSVNSTIFAQWTYLGGGSSGGGSSTNNNSTNDAKIIITPPASDKPKDPTQGEITVIGKVDSNGNADMEISDTHINDAIKKAEDNAKKNGNLDNGIIIMLSIDTGNKTVKTVAVNLSKTVQETIIGKKIVSTVVVVDNPDIRMAMDLSTIKEINKQANSDVDITATKSDRTKLSDNAKTIIENRPVFDLNVNYDSGKQVHNFGVGSISVAIPYTLGENENPDNVYAVYVDDNGNVKWLDDSVYDIKEKVLRFTTNHFSTYGVGYKQANTAFTDITNHWAKDDIEFVVSRGLFSGTSESTFSPNTAMTRGMFVTTLGRLAKADVSKYTKSSFNDVTANSYYMGYVEWAMKNNVVSGIGDGKFAPDQSITREQMAVIIANYARAIGSTMPKIQAENTFADGDKISTYAKEAVQQVQMAGIISGKNGNIFDSHETATRAEVSTVLRRFMELKISSDGIQS